MVFSGLFRPSVACVGLLATLLAACSGAASPDHSSGPMFTEDHGHLTVPDGSPLRQRLRIEAVQAQAIPHRIDVPATVEAEPSRTVSILAPLTGRVLAVKVSIGDRVKQGQVLAAIASGDMDQAYSDGAKADDALALASKALERARGVQQAGGAAIKDLETAQSNYTQAKAEDERARARLSSLGEAGRPGAVGKMPLLAPMDGVVTALSIASGAYIADTTASVMTVQNLDQVWISAMVPESESGQVRPGQTAEIHFEAYPGVVREAQVGTVEPVLQADSRREGAHIVVDNKDGHLHPNMFATVTIDVPQHPQVVVPQSALLMNNDSVSVLVEVAPWVFERRQLKIGYDEGTQTRVIDGLRSGERIVVSGGVLMND